MYRILVVDNEPYVADWIASLLESRCEKDVDVCRAYSAGEALKRFAQARIDILVSDICMPGMDGLELAEQVKSYWPYTQVILLTGFAEFNYAVAAIKSNVIGYVLKNQGDDVILREVERAIELLENDLRQRRKGYSGKENDMILSRLRTRLLRELLEKGYYDKNIEEQMQSLELKPGVDESIYMVISHTKEWESLNDLAQRFYAVQDLINQLEEYLEDCCSVHAVDMGGGRIVWLLYENRKREIDVPILALIQGRLELFQNIAEIRHSFILYPKELSLNDLHDAYLETEKTMKWMDAETDVLFIMNEENMLVMKQDLKSGISLNTVEALKKYISEHITEDISLTILSEVTGYSTNYLSRIFRAQTGEKLTDFIGKQKMNWIDQLMKDSKMGIGEVAEKAGFQSRTYFNRFIKRWTGMAPKDYRKELRNEK